MHIAVSLMTDDTRFPSIDPINHLWMYKKISRNNTIHLIFNFQAISLGRMRAQ